MQTGLIFSRERQYRIKRARDKSLQKSRKTDKIVCVRLFFLLVWTLIAVACGMSLKSWLSTYGRSREESAIMQEKDDKDYKRGIDFVNEGRYEQAINSFEKVIEKNPNAIESHLQLGTLKKQENRPFEAVYHLQQYLRRANLKNTRIIEDLIKGAQQDYLRTIPGRPFDTYKLSDTVEKKYDSIRHENDNLKRQLAISEARIKELESYAARPTRQPPTQSVAVVKKKKPVVVEQPKPTPEPDPVKNYTVQSGDTLGKISRKFYGTSARWQEIFNYNQDVLSDPAKLKPGMEIKIPPK